MKTIKMQLEKRTFEALKYDKESEERKELNKKTETSEYMSSQKFIVRTYHPETKTHLNYVNSRNFRTKKEAQEYIDYSLKFIEERNKI